MADPYNAPNYTEQGGARTVIGGSLDVVSGGEIDIESGGALKLAGAAIAATAAEVNKLAGVSAGTAVASKAAVLGANKNLDEIHTAALYLGAAAGTQITKTAAEINALAAGVAAGYKAARGVGAVTGALDVDTGLAAVVAAVACLKGDPTVAHAMWATVADGAAGHIILKVWRPTAANDLTPLAGDDAQNVQWLAIGT
jgi:hypothetical protein